MRAEVPVAFAMVKAERNLSLSASADAASCDEGALVKRLRRGDPLAAREFYALYSDRILRFILHALGPGGDLDGEDLLQDTFMALAEALPFFRGESSLFTFACAIAHRKTMSFLRARTRRGQIVAAQINVPEQSSVEPRRDEDLRRALASIRAEHREVLALKYVEDMTVAEIASVLSLSEHAVESRLARARKALGKALESK